MTQVMPEQIIERLAAEVTLSPEPPSEDLRNALRQLVFEVQTGSEPERPVDWAYQVMLAVQQRHDG
jgi:hypothetical protein